MLLERKGDGKEKEGEGAGGRGRLRAGARILLQTFRVKGGKEQ